MPDGSENPEGMKLLNENLAKKDVKVIIVTSRFGQLNDLNNKNMREFLKDRKLDFDVYFTNGKSKVDLLNKLSVNTHYDDDIWEIEDLEKTKVNGVRVLFDFTLWLNLMCN